MSFDLNDFIKNSDNTYSRKSNPQPRAIVKKIVYPNTIEFESGKSPKKKKETDKVYFNNMDIQDVYTQCERDGVIFLKGNVPSSKNAMVPFNGGMVYSKPTTDYKEQTDIHWRVFKSRFHEMLVGKTKPYKIEITFIRDSRRKADHHNLCQLPMDLMVKHKWLDDDNMDEALVFPGNPAYGYDPKLSGFLIRVL